jgi:hypothetical protein
MKKLLSVITMAVLSFNACAQHDHNTHASSPEKGTPNFKDETIGTVYVHYIHLKDALVASNADASQKAAGELEKSLASVTNGKKAQEAAKAIASSADLTQQRKSFSSLSNEMTTLVKTSTLASGAIYIEYCPMANKNEGGFWLSNEKEIRNPYFGDMMLKCGSVKETLE